MAGPSDALRAVRAEMEEVRRQVETLQRRLTLLSQRLLALEGTSVEPAAPPIPAPATPAPATATPATSPPGPTPVGRSGAPPRSEATLPPKEKRDAEEVIWTLVNRVGVVAMLFAVGFFLKYAFDNDWIGPWGRVAIGITGGAVLLGLGEREQRRNHALFAQGLTGGGIGVLYASFFAAYAYYKLVGHASAFGLMALVTVTAGVAAVRYASVTIALLGLIGGFLTPVLLRSGEDRQIPLFSYVLLLDVGVLVLAASQWWRTRWWRALLPVSLAGTVLLMVGWHEQFYGPEKFGRTVAVALVFFFLYAFAPAVDAARRAPAGAARYGVGTSARTTHWADLATLTAAGLFFFVYFAVLTWDYYPPSDLPSPPGRLSAGREHPLRAWYGAVALAFSAVQAAAAGLFLRRATGERGLAGTFGALCALGMVALPPMQFERGWVTIGWSVEAALAALAAAYALRRTLLTSASALWGLALVWTLAVDTHGRDALFTSSYTAAYLFLAASTLAARTASWGSRGWRWALTAAFHLAMVIALSREIHAWGWRSFAWSLPEGAEIVINRRAAQASLSVLWALYGSMMVASGFVRARGELRWLGLGLLMITAGKVFLVDLATLKAAYRIVSFLALGLLLLISSYLYVRVRRREVAAPPREAT